MVIATVWVQVPLSPPDKFAAFAAFLQDGCVAQLVRALRSHRRGRWFESNHIHHYFRPIGAFFDVWGMLKLNKYSTVYKQIKQSNRIGWIVCLSQSHAATACGCRAAPIGICFVRCAQVAPCLPSVTFFCRPSSGAFYITTQ